MLRCCVPGRLPAAQAAGDSGFLQHAAAQLQRRREGPQENGESSSADRRRRSIPSPVRFDTSAFARLLRPGFDERDGSDAPDGLQAHQLRQGEDDDDASHGSAFQRGLPSALLPVSTCLFLVKSSPGRVLRRTKKKS